MTYLTFKGTDVTVLLNSGNLQLPMMCNKFKKKNLRRMKEERL